MPSLRQSLVAFAVRRYPFYSGRGTLANHPLVQRLAGTSTEVAWGTVAGGHRICAPLDEYVGRAVFYAGELDPKITWVCSRLVRPGDTVLDIGANLGLVTCVLSSLVGPTGAVHAFEPIPEMQDLIDRAVANNHARNITLHRFALGDREEVRTLYIPDGRAGSSSLLAQRLGENVRRIEVTVRTLTNVLEAANLDPIRLIKIDVEGFEAAVLEGARECFSKAPPFAILFEYNDPVADIRKHPALSLLEQMGYGFFSLPKKMVRMRAHRLDIATATASDVSHDVLAVRLGAAYEEAARLVRAH